MKSIFRHFVPIILTGLLVVSCQQKEPTNYTTAMNRLSTSAVLVALTHCLSAQTYEFYEPLSSFQAEIGTLERKYTLKESREYYDRIHNAL